MNYLALASLHMVLPSIHQLIQNYILAAGPYQQKAKQLYDDLRKNVVENIVKEWERTGFTWEQYDQETGEGRSHPFDGWTGANALLIAAEVY
jgi:mannosyl-oligosaccharide glucosidase